MPQFKKLLKILPEAGRHLAELVSVKEVENQFYDQDQSENLKTQFEWQWVYVEKPDMEIRTYSTVYLNIHKGKKNKTIQHVEALEGKSLSQKEIDEFEGTDSLIGKQCYLTVEHYTGDDGKTKAKVEKFEPVPAKSEDIPF